MNRHSGGRMKHILFDLDGTLLPMDTDHFMKLYSEAVTKAFADFDAPEELFMKVMASVKHTVMDKTKKKNFDKFFDHFSTLVTEDVNTYIEHFNAFYEAGFEEVKAATRQSQAMLEAVKILREKGYKLYIATNPIFPMLANEKRIEWAGLDQNHFEYVSCFENNHYCKPHLEFFEEVLESNNLDPDQVLMVGNDAQEDLAIKALGVKTYLITDHLIDRAGHIKQSDFAGDYGSFLEFAKSLEKVED